MYMGKYLDLSKDGAQPSCDGNTRPKLLSPPNVFYRPPRLVIAFCFRQFCAEFCVTLTGHYRTNTGAILSF